MPRVTILAPNGKPAVECEEVLRRRPAAAKAGGVMIDVGDQGFLVRPGPEGALNFDVQRKNFGVELSRQSLDAHSWAKRLNAALDVMGGN